MTSTSRHPILRMAIFGAPATKKNHGQIAMVKGKPKIFPSKQYRRWVREARIDAEFLPAAPIDIPVNIKADFYRARRIGDAVGYYQALADFLELCLACKKKNCECGVRQYVLENDRWLASWDGSRLLKDAANPRIELELVPW